MTKDYQIRIEGHLGNQWADWFDGLSITLEADGKRFFLDLCLISLPYTGCYAK